jgi:branched-chain amino acid transport system substrate-binding protein
MKKLNFASVLLFAIVLFSCKNEHQIKNTTAIKIGGLFSKTGNWSSLGKTSEAAMNIALVDVNHYLEEKGSDIRFESVVYDTQLDTSSAKSAIQIGFSQRNIKFFIGPQSSAEVAAIRQYADDNNILVISQGSTASSLAIPNDAIFRFCPGDAVEGAAISKTIYNSGKRIAITLSRNDAGNIGLQTSVGSNFASLGGQVDAISPYATSITDFSSIIQQIRTKIQQYSNTYSNNQIAVYIASFDECVNLFRQAASDPILTSVNWYGGDGMVQSSVLLSDTQARTFAMTTNFFAPNFGLPAQAHPQLSSIMNAIQNSTGIEPDAYALSVYDAMWVLARTLSSYPDVLQDFSSLKTEFSQEANQYFGITGPVLLNANGDRNIGAFDYWGIVNQGGNYIWKVVGKSN